MNKLVKRMREKKKMKTKFNKLFIMFFALSLTIVSCGDDERTVVNPNNPGVGTDNVFRGLLTNGDSVGLPAGAKLRRDAGGDQPIAFSMRIAPNNQTATVNGINFVPSYVTFPTGVPGPLDFFAVSEIEYDRSTTADPFGGDDNITYGSWQRVRFAVEGHGTVSAIGGRNIFQGEIILYTMNAATDFSFDTGTFGIRVSFGGSEPPRRQGTIR